MDRIRSALVSGHFFRSYCSISPRASWDIFAAVALIRPPIIAPPFNEIEKRYQNVMMQKEYEKSLRCDFELRQIRDGKLLREREKLKQIDEEINLKEEIGILAAVDEENWRKEADRIRKQLSLGDLTKSPKADDRSLQRKIDEPLVLIVRQKFGRKDGYQSPWLLPQLQNEAGETLKQTVDRCCKEFFPVDMHLTGISNAPFSVLTYKYPNQLRQHSKLSSKGSVIFFFKAVCASGIEFKSNANEIGDYKWVNAEEFTANIKHATSYLRALSTLFPSDLLTKYGIRICKDQKFKNANQPTVKAQAVVMTV